MVEDIVARILSDAEGEAQNIISEAEKRAEEILAAAKAQAAQNRAEAEREVAQKAQGIAEGKAAAARLDGAKVTLGEKRRVLDTVYSIALAALVGLNKKDSVALAERLLSAHAEKGEEILFSLQYPYVDEVMALPIVKKLALTASSERVELGGGFVLRGKTCDKDLSYPALIEADRSAHQAELATALFKGN